MVRLPALGVALQRSLLFGHDSFRRNGIRNVAGGIDFYLRNRI